MSSVHSETRPSTSVRPVMSKSAAVLRSSRGSLARRGLPRRNLPPNSRPHPPLANQHRRAGGPWSQWRRGRASLPIPARHSRSLGRNELPDRRPPFDGWQRRRYYR